MLIKFDQSKVEFRYLKIKSVNPMNGQLFFIDEKSTNEKTIRYECPKSLARLFKETFKTSTYQIPHECCVMFYDNNVIALERSTLNQRYVEKLDGSVDLWKPNMIHVYNKILNEINENWYFDGQYLFSINNDPTIDLDDNHQFKAVPVTSILLNYIGLVSEYLIETRHCLEFNASNNTKVITPPIWKSLTSISSNKLKSEELTSLNQFDKIDNKMAVNLQFAIIAGINLSKIFGYQVIEPLQIPKLMIQLKTVNLQSMSTELKQTFDIGMTFTQACAWLMGLSRDIKDFNDMLALKKMIRYLTTSGIYIRNKIDQVNVQQNIPLLSIEEAYANVMQKMGM